MAQQSWRAAKSGDCMGKIRAIIDIGTNSVKLLVADVEGSTVTRLFEDSEQTRLGQGFYETSRLLPEAILTTAQSVQRWAKRAAAFFPERLEVIATSAAREALNQAELLEVVGRESGLRVRVISGETEAAWAYMGVTTNPNLSSKNILVLDVGGGSTEFILGKGMTPLASQSFKMGTVRLLETFPPKDPPTAEDLQKVTESIQHLLKSEVAPFLDPYLAQLNGEPLVLVGTGGTSTLLARMALKTQIFDADAVDRVELGTKAVTERNQQLWQLPLALRRMIRGLPAPRADVILMGSAIYAAVMRQFNIDLMRISTRGLRFAALLE